MRPSTALVRQSACSRRAPRWVRHCRRIIHILHAEYPMRTKPLRTLTPLALAVLELLQERAVHPYEMQQTIRERYIDYVIKVRAGSLYHTVERLHRLKLI